MLICCQFCPIYCSDEFLILESVDFRFSKDLVRSTVCAVFSMENKNKSSHWFNVFSIHPFLFIRENIGIAQCSLRTQINSDSLFHFVSKNLLHPTLHFLRCQREFQLLLLSKSWKRIAPDTLTIFWTQQIMLHLFRSYSREELHEMIKSLQLRIKWVYTHYNYFLNWKLMNCARGFTWNIFSSF